MLLVDGEPLAYPFDLEGLMAQHALLPSRHLLGEAEEYYALEGRVALLICPLCGDIGCGAVFARITVEAERVRWTDFLYANNYMPEDDRPLEGSFEFDRSQYEQALSQRP